MDTPAIDHDSRGSCGYPFDSPAWLSQSVPVNDETRKPIAEVLPGFSLHSLEDGWTPLQAFVLIKSLDEEGETSWSFRTSEQLNLEELLGALTIQVDILRNKLVQQWEDEDG